MPHHTNRLRWWVQKQLFCFKVRPLPQGSSLIDANPLHQSSVCQRGSDNVISLQIFHLIRADACRTTGLRSPSNMSTMMTRANGSVRTATRSAGHPHLLISFIT